MLDVAEKKIVKTLDVEEEDVLIAAGETRLVIFQRGKGIISRYKLGTWKRELSVACEPYTKLAMGSSSEGPLLALSTGAVTVDLTTLKPTGTTMSGYLAIPGNLQAAANGQVFGNCDKRDASLPTGLMVLSIVDGKTARELRTYERWRRHSRAGRASHLYHSGKIRPELRAPRPHSAGKCHSGTNTGRERAVLSFAVGRYHR